MYKANVVNGNLLLQIPPEYQIKSQSMLLHTDLLANFKLSTAV